MNSRAVNLEKHQLDFFGLIFEIYIYRDTI